MFSSCSEKTRRRWSSTTSSMTADRLRFARHRLARRPSVRSPQPVHYPMRSTVMRLPLTMLAVALIAVPAHASELTGTLQKVKETNKIILGIQEASVPFSYLDGDQKAIGYAVDICMKIVDAVKHQLN